MTQAADPFPLTPIYDQLRREQEQPCPPPPDGTGDPDQAPPSAQSDDPAWPSSPPE